MVKDQIVKTYKGKAIHEYTRGILLNEEEIDKLLVREVEGKKTLRL
jgi:hypothetical protein